MALTVDVACPNGHQMSATLEGVPNITTLNVGGKIELGSNCPVCGAGPLTAPGGYYEPDENGIMKRIGDFRP